jgi:4-diphosphocytidyl-2-C-methyl-D-erythritol kinase
VTTQMPPENLFAKLSIASYAKLNLTLNVTGRRPDGFHELVSLMALLDLADELLLEPQAEQNAALISMDTLDTALTLVCDHPDLQSLPQEKNLVHKAFVRFWQTLGTPPPCRVLLTLTKVIPTQAGLGGGSSNAAAMLLLLNAWQQQRYAPTLPQAVLLQLATELGSDVPFFVAQTPLAVCRGRGELVTPLQAPVPKGSLLLVKPKAHSISTPWAYQQLVKRSAYKARPIPYGWRTEAMVQVAPSWFNDFEAVLTPQLAFLQDMALRLRDLEAYKTLLCGSGSAMVGCFQAKPSPSRLSTLFPLEHFWWQWAQLQSKPNSNS